MAKVVNLRQARKAKTRLAKEKTASENAVKFGRTKVQRATEEADSDRMNSRLDAHQLDE